MQNRLSLNMRNNLALSPYQSDPLMLSDQKIPSKLSLLLVDDEEFNLKALKRMLHGQGFNIFCARDGVSALEVMEREEIAIIVSDMRMPNMSGDELLIQIDERWPETLKIILTGYTDISDTLNVLNSSSIYRYISKPWDDDFLLSTIHEAAAIYWGKIMDYCFEKTTKEQNEKLKESNYQLRHSVEQSQLQLKKVNEKLKSSYDGEKRLRRERQAAERENLAKSQFLATMSHEIRTPLNAIISTNSLLLESELSSEQKELVKLSLNGGNTLLALINDILDFSKINAGKLELHEEWFNITDVVDEICELLSGQVVNKPVDIITLIEPGTPLELLADETRIRQIITNLVSNALKFTESGCVTVSLSFNNALVIRVEDSGIGMSNDDVALIFEEFTQVDNSSTRMKGGTGLGLSICKQLVSLMQGSIDVSSSLDHGSCFTVSLPLPSRNHIAFPQALLKPDNHAFTNTIKSQVQLRLISTNQHLFNALKQQLNFFNIHLSLSTRLTDNQTQDYHATIYDTDTICFFLDLAKSDLSHARPPINIALISNDGVDKAKQLKRQGFDLVLRKPLRVSTLAKHFISALQLELNDKALNSEQVSIIKNWLEISPSTAMNTSENALNATILLAEDSPSNQAVFNSILKKMAVHVDIAENGDEAVDMANSKPYDLILMDMAMPVKDGISAAKAIIQHSTNNANTPIIALTANAYAEDKKRCFEAGMLDFISKPIDVTVFRQKVLQWCNYSENQKKTGKNQQNTSQENTAQANSPQLNKPSENQKQLVAGHRASSTAAQTDPSKERSKNQALTVKADDQPTNQRKSAKHTTGEHSILNQCVLKQLEKDTSAEVLPSIIDIFLAETQKRLPQMLEYAEKQDWPGLSSEAHTLKSSAGSFGAIALQEIAKQLEDAIANDTYTTVQALVAQLPEIGQQSLAALEHIKQYGIDQ